MEKEKNKNLLVLIGISAICILCLFSYSVGRIQGQFESAFHFADYMNEYKLTLNNETRYIYINKSCQMEELNLYSKWLEQGYLNREDLTYN